MSIVMARPNGPAPAGRNGRSPPTFRPAGAQKHRRTCPYKHAVPPGRARAAAAAGAWPHNRLCTPGVAVAPKGPERWLDLPRPHPLLITPEVARVATKMTVPAAFTVSETFAVSVDLGSPVARDYFERAPFKFNGKIQKVKVELK